MCFSAEADAAMAVVIGAIAVDGLRHVREPSHLALASLPVVLAFHQLVEVFVWWGVEGRVAESVFQAAVYTYLVIAFGLPLLVPRAVRAIEPRPDRQRLMERMGIVGAFVAVILLGGVFTGPVTAVDHGDHLSYEARLFHGGVLTAVYVVVTLGTFLASSHRLMVIYGAVNLVAVVVLAITTITGFVSLWCAWAAVSSLVIVYHLRHSQAHASATARMA
ncbi:MAG: DUF6629 family protein [Actinomycetota bacterium]